MLMLVELLSKLQLAAGDFVPIDGGIDRACRGASSGDNNPIYYVIQNGISDLDGCKAICVIDALCQGESPAQRSFVYKDERSTLKYFWISVIISYEL